VSPAQRLAVAAWVTFASASGSARPAAPTAATPTAAAPTAAAPTAATPTPAAPSAAAPTPAAPSAAAPTAAATIDPYAAVTPGRLLEFPADYGSHPEFRTEWWYITGWLKTARGESLGFQVTFFRTRPPLTGDNPSSFTPHQLLVAHCAISDPTLGHLWQDQRIRRAGLGLAEAKTGDTDVRIDDWTLERRAGEYRTHIPADDFALDLAFRTTQPPLLNGESGVSQKGPAAASASYYYSIPHLGVSGIVTRAGKPEPVSGEAWFDHEWSSEYLDSQAVGWDWIGIDLDDGGALMAFRIRDATGAARWAGGTYVGPDGRVQPLAPQDVSFTAVRSWVSPRTGIRYPVAWSVHAGTRDYELRPLMDDQENDTRLSTGAIYWEGAVRAFAAGQPVGRGYLELTGYGEKLKLR
jgi:predicted secreted hydrolase